MITLPDEKWVSAWRTDPNTEKFLEKLYGGIDNELKKLLGLCSDSSDPKVREAFGRYQAALTLHQNLKGRP